MNKTFPDSPYIELTRTQWSELRKSLTFEVSEKDLEELRGLGEHLDLKEITDIYFPLARLINLEINENNNLFDERKKFLDKYLPLMPKVPFIIGIAGSVAVGKSTTARVLQFLLSKMPEHKKVDLITTDGFLYSNKQLEKKNILERKGFPESYDTKKLLKFVSDIKSGKRNVTSPVYSHFLYDIVADKYITVDQPDVLIIEGLNVLQTGKKIMVSDFFDFSIYVDAKTEEIEEWFLKRIKTLRDTSFSDPKSFFHTFTKFSETELQNIAEQVWKTVNKKNLIKNIAPTKPRANLILIKDKKHSIKRIKLKKI